MTQEEAIKTVDRIFNYCEEIDCHLPEDEQTGYDMYPDIRAVIEYIRNTPEIVRCKDCKYLKRNWCLCEELPICGDDATTFEPDEDFFCKYGERREKDE